MTLRKAIAITPDRALGRHLRIALAAAGVESSWVTSVADAKVAARRASLVIVQLSGTKDRTLAALARHLRDDCLAVALVPRAELSQMVAVLQGDERVMAVFATDGLQPADITATATRLLFGDVFGLEKVVPWGVRIHSVEVGSYEDKHAAVERVDQFAKSIGVRQRHRDWLEQCCDEMLMNAIYDAPSLAPAAPAAPAARAVLEYACDGQRFALAVRDLYGTFERSALVGSLDRCIRTGGQVHSERRTGGAGIGLYLIASRASSLMFNVLPGIATECICTFELGDGPRTSLTQIAVFREQVDASGRVPPRPRRAGRRPVERRRANGVTGTHVPLLVH